MLVSAVKLNSIGGKNTLSIQAAEFTLMQSDFLLNKVIRTLVIGFYTTEALFGEQNTKGFNCRRRDSNASYPPHTELLSYAGERLCLQNWKLLTCKPPHSGSRKK